MTNNERETIALAILLPFDKILVRFNTKFPIPVKKLSDKPKKHIFISPFFRLITRTRYADRDADIKKYINGIYKGIFHDTYQRYVLRPVEENAYTGGCRLYMVKLFDKVSFNTIVHEHSTTEAISFSGLCSALPVFPSKEMEYDGYSVSDTDLLSNIASDTYIINRSKRAKHYYNYMY